jgi:DNA-binding transcriptional MerR regulator
MLNLPFRGVRLTEWVPSGLTGQQDVQGLYRAGHMEDRSAQYRIGQLASRTGVAPELLRKWEARYALLEPSRSAGGFRIYSREDEQRVRLMQRHLTQGYAAGEAAELAKQGIIAPAPARLSPRLPKSIARHTREQLTRAAADYDEGAAERALDDVFRAFTVDAIIRDALMPFLRRLGEAWAAGTATVGQEHFASRLIEARLMSLTRGWGSGSGPRALLACPPRELHTLGLLAFGIALARRGWRITYLGADTPLDALEDAASRTEPRTIVLAAAQAQTLSESADKLRQLAQGWPLQIAGAGASAATARVIRATYIEADPVTAASELAKKRPA